jgi:hypothetical protein
VPFDEYPFPASTSSPNDRYYSFTCIDGIFPSRYLYRLSFKCTLAQLARFPTANVSENVLAELEELFPLFGARVIFLTDIFLNRDRCFRIMGYPRTQTDLEWSCRSRLDC